MSLWINFLYVGYTTLTSDLADFYDKLILKYFIFKLFQDNDTTLSFFTTHESIKINSNSETQNTFTKHPTQAQ